MYLRFVVADIHQDSQQALGVFHAVGNLRDSGTLLPHEEAEHDLVRAWFNEHLKKPGRFTASRPPFGDKQKKAISWFKDSASEHLARVKLLVAMLQDHGFAVRMLRTDRVGYVVYEDEYQIVAEPFAETRLAGKTLPQMYRQRRGFLKALLVGAAAVPLQSLLGAATAKSLASPDLHRPPLTDMHKPPIGEIQGHPLVGSDKHRPPLVDTDMHRPPLSTSKQPPR